VLTFIYLQFGTTFFSVRYFGQITSMICLGILSAAECLLALSGRLHPLSPWLVRVVVIVSFVSSVVWFALALAKIVLYPNMRVQPSWKLLTEYLSSVSVPHREFVVRTSDQVDIRGVHINRGKPKAVIFCHGGASSKDALATALSCDWLAEDYDVIAFDFRGHLESGGVWTGDTKVALDVKAVVDYAKGHDYQKIGLVGTSLGAWAAIVEAALYHDVDAVVAASPPPTTMRAVPGFESLFDWGMDWWAAPVRWLVRIMLGVRFANYGDDVSLGTLIDDMAGIPLLLTFYTRDPTIGMDADEFKQLLYQRAEEPKDLIIYQGSAHVTTPSALFRFHSDVRAWLARHL
jgi:pimeloyl-ACP methyl ester carboxylesterase